jgi:hypothetical protein
MLIAAALAFATACGSGSSTSQSEARDRATTVTCDWYAACSNIGAGKMYATRESCEVDVRAKWEAGWPHAACDGKIVQSQLETCLTAIHSTECANGFDILNTLGNKCPQAKVCSGGSSPDGG